MTTRLPSIRSRLAGLVVACLVPASVAVTFLFFQSYQRERVQLEREQVAVAHALALAVDRDLASTLTAASILATHPSLQTDDLRTFYERASDIVRLGIGNNVVLSDATGQPLVNTLKPFGEALPRLGHADQLVKIFESGKASISDMFIGGVLGRPLSAVDVPVFRGGKVVYAISVVVRPEHLAELLAQQHLPPEWIAGIFDTTGTIVTRTHGQETYVGKNGVPAIVDRIRQDAEGVVEITTLEGVSSVAAFSRSQISHWSVVVAVPKDLLFAPLHHSLLLIGGGALSLIAVAFALAWLLGGRIAGSIQALVAPALALGSGKAVTAPPLAVREAADLAQALVTASTLIQTRTAERDQATQGKELLAARLRLVEVSRSASLHDLLVATLDEACLLIGAETGFYHFLLPDQQTLSLQAWSTRTTREFCQAAPEAQHYDIHRAGIWADAVRLRRSVVCNDYTVAPNRQGLPEGHSEVNRFMSIPISRGGQIKAIIGLGNKAEDFEVRDLEAVETLADMAWDLAERKQAEDALAERSELVERRYESLRALNDVAALPPAASDQLEQALALGAKHLSLQLGIISRVDGDRYTVLHHCAPADVPLHDGQEFELGKTYCALTMQAGEVVAIAHMGLSPYASHPCYQEFRLEAYIGAPIRVGDVLFGTVNFTSPVPYRRAFDDGDVEFVRLLARWVGSVLERKLAEAEVRRAKEAAEKRARELAISNSDLEQFAYVASHDLREPLRMISSYITLLERSLGDSLSSDQHEFLGYARDGAKRMDRLVLDLLELSRIGRRGSPKEVVDLGAVARQAVSLLQVAIDEVGGRVEVEGELGQVVGVGDDLVRLFQNLIGNALKYHHPERPPVVTVGARRQGAEYIITVADNGIGIETEHFERIFGVFQRLHSRDSYEGTGIGLAICKKIVEHHGGRIWVESVFGEGSAFLFTLPASP